MEPAGRYSGREGIVFIKKNKRYLFYIINRCVYIYIYMYIYIFIIDVYIYLYYRCTYIFIILQSQEILSRPVFVLEILRKSEQILNILNIDSTF